MTLFQNGAGKRCQGRRKNRWGRLLVGEREKSGGGGGEKVKIRRNRTVLRWAEPRGESISKKKGGGSLRRGGGGYFSVGGESG